MQGSENSAVNFRSAFPGYGAFFRRRPRIALVQKLRAIHQSPNSDTDAGDSSTITEAARNIHSGFQVNQTYSGGPWR